MMMKKKRVWTLVFWTGPPGCRRWCGGPFGAAAGWTWKTNEFTVLKFLERIKKMGVHDEIMKRKGDEKESLLVVHY